PREIGHDRGAGPQRDQLGLRRGSSGPQRLSVTFRVLAAAKEVWVLASGAGKEQALVESLRAGGTTPLAHLISLRTRTTIMTDLPRPTR
ncbi:MAG: 6-phosphogluconolactonase, partial [Verrucomicrobiota bacterium]